MNSEKAKNYRKLHVSGRKNVDYCSTCSLDGPNEVERQALKVFDVKNSMNMKKSLGGTSVINVKSMIKKYKREI